MSTAEQAEASALQAMFRQFEVATLAREATKYLTVSGFVLLIYDHVLLFGEEINSIWPAKRSWSKSLFLFNRYVVPLYITTALSSLTGSTVGSPNQTWFSSMVFINVTTLAANNIFVAQRVYALWGYNRKVLTALVAAMILLYLAMFAVAAYGVFMWYPHVSYNHFLRMCIIEVRPTLGVVSFAGTLFFDIFLFLLMCCNALDRPRHMHTTVVKLLYRDGAVYFAITTALRLFNIFVIAFADIAYSLLGVYFTTSLITALINRMLITISTSVKSEKTIGSPREITPYGPLETPFELSAMVSAGNEGVSPNHLDRIRRA